MSGEIMECQYDINPKTGECKVTRKKWKPTKNPLMLNRIKALSYSIFSTAGKAQLATTEKQRDKLIVRIMSLTEKIEKEYSQNWH